MPAVQVTFQPDPRLPAAGRLLCHDLGDGEALRDLCARWGLHGERDKTRLVLPGPEGLTVEAVDVHAVPLAAALPVLASLPTHEGIVRIPESLRFWSLAARLSLRLVAAGRIVPDLVRVADETFGVWGAVDDDEGAATFARVAAAAPLSAVCLAWDHDRVWAPEALLAAFRDAVADLAVRSAADRPPSGRPRERVLPWTARWAEALGDRSDARVPLSDDRDELLAGVRSWQRGLDGGQPGGVLQLSLLAPLTGEGAWTLRLALRADDGRLLDAAEVWEAGPALQEAMLRGLAAAARAFPPLDQALGGTAPEALVLDRAAAWAFVRDAQPLLEEAGIVVMLPEDLAQDQLAIRLRVEDDGDTVELPGTAIRTSWEVTLGEAVLSSDDLDALLATEGPLVWWKEHWLRLDAPRRERLRRLGGSGSVPLLEGLALALAGTVAIPAGLDPGAPGDEAEVVAEGTIADLADRIRGAVEWPPVPPVPDGFVGTLRPYQQRGVAWLGAMAELGLGGILADDMGLGKTIQFIAHLLLRERDRPSLIVCPTSVVGNWEREVNRFAPGLRVTRFHGPERDLEQPGDIVLTTYGMLRLESDTLAEIDWDVIALDEAQHVKNPATAGARAVRRLRSRQRVALTGTPLENRLDDLWSLMDATNPGLLGPRARFARRYGNPIERQRDARAARRLRRLVSPFVLRREKRDPAVIQDLPDKIERTVVCALTQEQAALYERAVSEALDPAHGVSAASGIQRHGRVLALFTALKQICNHPAQYLAEGEAGTLAGRSGKLAAAREIIMEAIQAGDRLVVFTQFVAMGHLLVRQLSEDLGMRVPFLHGSVPAGARDRMVDDFQDSGCPVLVVSLRAGGTGLNLTAATHVVHYDRWWNPAVEDQATDRTHRIGQLRTVEVHKLVTAGTIEERVAQMLERKRSLAESVVGAGERWLTDLGDEEIAELVALSRSGVEELDDELDWTPAAIEEAS